MESSGNAPPRAPIIEFVGLPGSGKSSVTKLLLTQSSTFVASKRLKLGSLKDAPRLAYYGLQIAPLLFDGFWKERRYTRDEAKQLVYLHSMAPFISRQTLSRDGTDQAALLIDQGPIYYLTHLKAFGPTSGNDDRFNRWYKKMLLQWAKTLDIIIWLDGPDDLLLQRVMQRDKWHPLKGGSQKQAKGMLLRHRISLTKVIHLMQESASIQMVTYQTELHSARSIADDVLNRLNRLDQMGNSYVR